MVSTTHPQTPVVSFALEEDTRGPGLSLVNTLSGGRCFPFSRKPTRGRTVLLTAGHVTINITRSHARFLAAEVARAPHPHPAPRGWPCSQPLRPRARVPEARSGPSETHLVPDLTSMCESSPPAAEVAKGRPRPAVGRQARESILGSAY